MDWQKLLCSFIVIWHLSSPVHGYCRIVNQTSGCEYFNICLSTITYQDIPYCNSTSNVTFILKQFSINTLTSNFFLATSSNFDNRVKFINANSNSFQTIGYDAFYYFKYISYLDISQNDITNIDSKPFESLFRMKHLNLSHNKIHVLGQDSLKFSDTSQLEILDLSNNSFDFFGDMFFDFPSLRELYLQNNKIKTISDNCFASLKKLLNLIIRNNLISDIFNKFDQLEELKILDVSHNDIHNISGLDHLVNLVNLNMSHNNITIVDRLYGNQKLELLDLSYNKISPTLEKHVFAPNQRLVYLDLYQNNLVTVNLEPNVNIRFLNLEKNNLTGDVNSSNFTGLQAINSLNITHQYIKAIKANAFFKMENLKYVNLSHNLISKVENSSFANASALAVLDLSYNLIESVFFFEMISSNVTEIYINNNNILTVPERILENHKKLERFDISYNSIIMVGQNALPLNNLKFLNIKNNDLNGTLVDNVLSPAKLINNIDLSGLKLKKLNDSALINLPLVTEINLSHNHLDFIHPNNFKGVDQIYSLDLSYNNLSNMVLYNKLQNLKEIVLSNNHFRSIPNIFGNNSTLILLDISKNNLPNITVEHLPQVRRLDLSYNNITVFNNKYTNSLACLTELFLISNRITEMVNISYFKHLSQLNVTNNEISFINNSYFGSNKYLYILSLAYNKITEIKPASFQSLTNLLVLDLSFNLITDIGFGSFRGLSNTIVLNLSGNKLAFIKEELFHECSELRTLIIDYNYIKRIDVDKMAKLIPNLSILSLGGNPIACHEVVRSKLLNHDVTLTSLHKIYHEDNVHGIQCGDTFNNNETTNLNTTKVLVPENLKRNDPIASFLFALLGVFCALLIFAFAYYYIMRSRIHIKFPGMRLRFLSNETNYGNNINLLS